MRLIFTIAPVFYWIFREKKSLDPRVLLSHSSCVKDMKSTPTFKRIYQLWFSLSLFPLFPFEISLFPILFQSCKFPAPSLWNMALELASGPISPSCHETASQSSKISTRIFELNKLDGFQYRNDWHQSNYYLAQYFFVCGQLFALYSFALYSLFIVFHLQCVRVRTSDKTRSSLGFSQFIDLRTIFLETWTGKHMDK